MRVAVVFVVVYLAFDRLAAALGSTRGERGLVVSAAVLALAALAERWLSRSPLDRCLVALGLRRPAPRALVAAAAVSLAMLACLPLLARATGTDLVLRPGAPWLALGMLAQGGVAEEALFRGLLYRHLRSTRTFWRAASLSAVPFALAHVPLFFSFGPALALSALAVAISWSFPLAWLFERAGGSLWPGALLHATIQAGIKVLVDDAPTFPSLALSWTALGLAAPWLLFLLRPRPDPGTSGAPPPHA
jgi:membrane protease YdiL (CAAX protease family)